jgi:hypothetical protein
MRKYSNLSRDSALAAWAAWDQGKFWEMHDKLFEKAPYLDPPVIDNIAVELGLDMARFRAAMGSEKNLAELQKNLDLIHDIDVWSTPTTIINGVMIKGANPYENYKKAVDEALGGTGLMWPFEKMAALILRALTPELALAEGTFGLGKVPLFVKVPQARPVNDLKVGEEAPDFTLPGIFDRDVSLSEYRGKKNVLLTFLPAAFTPV